MADAKLTALTAASALAAADLFYVSQSAASRKATGAQLLALVGTAYVPLAGGTMTGALTLPAGAVGTPSLMFTGAGATTGIYSAGSNEISFAVGGARVAYINAGNLLSTGVISASGGLNAAGGNFLISSNTGALAMGTSYDVWLYRDAAATLAQRNGTTQQTFRLYNTYTDASNYERLTLTGVAGTSVNITAESLGTGSANLDVVITPKGTGKVKFASGTFVNSNGYAFLVGIQGTYSGFDYSGHGVQFPTEGVLSWVDTGNFITGTKDTGVAKTSAGIVEINNGTAGTYRDLKLRNLLNTEYHQMTEMTAPSAPATNSVRIYAEDNGSGKTRLMALFATGAAQQLAIEP